MVGWLTRPIRRRRAKALGFPGSGWHRAHYLGLFNLLTRSVLQISERLETARLDDWVHESSGPR